MYCDGKLCSWFENGLGACFLNGSRCDNPFSSEGCRIQCERIFKDPNFQKNDYKPADIDEHYTNVEIMKRLCVGKKDKVADWFIPYSKFDTIGACPSEIINGAYEEIDKKFEAAGYCGHSAVNRIFHNVEFAGQMGIYVVGVLHY